MGPRGGRGVSGARQRPASLLLSYLPSPALQACQEGAGPRQACGPGCPSGGARNLAPLIVIYFQTNSALILGAEPAW